MYTVSADAKGFGKTLSAKFKVDINENATTNLTLKVAGATQTVQVTAEAQAIQTSDAETGQVVNRRFINDLPLIDRNVIELVNLAPGVTEMDDQCDVTCTGTNFVSNGSRGAPGRHPDRWRFGHELRTQRRHHGGDLPSVSRGSGRIQGGADELQRGIWLLRIVGGQHDHALGHEQVSRQRV